MDERDEDALREVNSLESARLAIRGALATIRDLQNQNLALKAELQDSSGRQKAAESRIAELSSYIARFQEEAKKWEDEKKAQKAQEEQLKNALRLQVREEEKARIEESRALTEEQLSRLKAELGRMAATIAKKEEQWAAVKREMEEREGRIIQLEKDKAEQASSFYREGEALSRAREQRDQELSKTLAKLQADFENRAKEIDALKAKNEDLKRDLARAADEADSRVLSKEEELLRDYRAKETALQERYSKREMELQASWAELENGLWKRAKDARAQLDAAAQQQFDEKAKALAERSREIETSLAARRQELDEQFARKSSESEARYAAVERKLLDEWADKEKRLLSRVDEELSQERLRLENQFSDRTKTLESDLAQRAASLERRKADLEADYRHKVDRSMEDAARKDADRIQRQDDFVLRKTAELDRAFEERLEAFKKKELALAQAAQEREAKAQEALLQKETVLSEQLNRLKLEFMAEQRKLLASEKAALEKALEEKTRQVEASYHAKVAESERAQAALEEQYKVWKAGLLAENIQRQKHADQQWYIREQELIRHYETSLEEQRRAMTLENRKTEEEMERLRRRFDDQLKDRERALEEDFARRQIAQQDETSRMLREAEEKFASREKDIRKTQAHQDADAAASRMAALQKQQESYLERISKAEVEHRQELAAWKAQLIETVERQKNEWFEEQSAKLTLEKAKIEAEKENLERELLKLKTRKAAP